jgi:uncharacterized membrane protein YtjA (UPF0391 family)
MTAKGILLWLIGIPIPATVSFLFHSVKLRLVPIAQKARHRRALLSPEPTQKLPRNQKRDLPLLPSAKTKEIAMLYYALVFLVVALIAGVLGFGGIAGASASIAQVLFFLFLILFVVSLIMRLMRRT